MNIGQLLETQFGMASWKLGQKISIMANDGSTTKELRSILKEIYVSEKQQKDIDAMSAEELKTAAKRLEIGVPVATPVFAGAKERDILDMMQRAGLSAGTYRLYDGRTGEPFDRDILVGKQYLMKLHHLVEDKIHARSVGPYCIITQQPLKSRANLGGQRVGEMEVWALEGYGAAFNLLEMMTIKSDDIDGRAEVFDEIVRNGRYHLGGVRTEALNVLLKELQGLCLDIEFENEAKNPAHTSASKHQ
jgi:DNA-directed RNA polymerase subunit beta